MSIETNYVFSGAKYFFDYLEIRFVTEEEISQRLAVIRESIRVIRESKNISRKTLDDKLALEPGASSKLERGGTKDITVSRLLLLSEIFDVDIRRFFGGMENANEDGVSYSKGLLNEQDLINIRHIIYDAMGQGPPTE